jgi:hypothetical protein
VVRVQCWAYLWSARRLPGQWYCSSERARRHPVGSIFSGAPQVCFGPRPNRCGDARSSGLSCDPPRQTDRGGFLLGMMRIMHAQSQISAWAGEVTLTWGTSSAGIEAVPIARRRAVPGADLNRSESRRRCASGRDQASRVRLGHKIATCPAPLQ